VSRIKSKYKGQAIPAVTDGASPGEIEAAGSYVKGLHYEMQEVRQHEQRDVSIKSYLTEVYGDDMTPEKFYKTLGIDMAGMTVNKMLTTGDMTRYLFPEVFRDAIVRGMEYTPFFKQLIVGEETVDSTGLTMPSMDWRAAPLGVTPRERYQLRDVNEGATIPEAEVVVYSEKQVTIHKKARGLKQTYESLMFVPINLASVYFEELGVVMGADMDRDLINIAINGDQADNSQSAPVIGVATANTLLYTDIARAWIRFKRINRNSAAMLASEADAITILNMDQFARKYPVPAQNLVGVTINVNTPLPSNQDILVHDAVPVGKLVMVDDARAFVQLTAMPLLLETDKIISRQINETFVSIITGFANVFKDGRMILDYTTSLTTNPGPTVFS
jgi:hypothetical protein